MRYKPGHREESRAKILDAVGRGFRKHGYGGIGVDGLAKEAGVTSGAVYTHFPSKAAAFKEAVSVGMASLREGIEKFQAENGDDWLGAFVDFYMGFKRTCDLTEACAMQALTPEVVRADPEVRAVYQDEMLKVIDTLAKRLPQPTLAARRAQAWALMSLLSGVEGQEPVILKTGDAFYEPVGPNILHFDNASKTEEAVFTDFNFEREGEPFIVFPAPLTEKIDRRSFPSEKPQVATANTMNVYEQNLQPGAPLPALQAGETGYLYVAKGAVSVKVRGEAPIVYLTGQTFYQPKSAPDTQVVNASKTDAAKVISFRLSNSK
ncbi:TetR family transcriptional regulator [Pseudomonas oryzihabitans]|uniref:TetR family transcriptional regulator n=1 Tax=Pseudomonas oryzihabitans TaxID=47885 RepID=UPI00069741A3|nr:TetR family transcriptional regulator [Pseudomonas oryzihabitans]